MRGQAPVEIFDSPEVCKLGKQVNVFDYWVRLDYVYVLSFKALQFDLMFGTPGAELDMPSHGNPMAGNFDAVTFFPTGMITYTADILSNNIAH